VVNATGLTSDNLPYFALTDTSQNVRIEFPRTRARFAVSLSVMQFIESQPQDSDGDGIFDTDDLCPLDPNNDIDNDEICGDVDRCPLDFDNDVDSDGICGDVDVCPLDPLNDSDGDGVCDGEDICPVDANNDCILIEGIVNGGGSAIANAQVELGNGGNTVFTSLSGDFSGNIQASTLSSDGSRQFFPINVKAQGFATGNAKVPFVPGQFNYRIVVSLQQVSDTIEESEDVTQSGGVEIVKNGNPVGSLEIPLTSLPTGVTQVTGTVTYLDPETEDLLSMPGGDLLALPEGADPNTDEPVILESFGMMEFNLFDQEGNEITTLSDDAEVCMKATSSLSNFYACEACHFLLLLGAAAPFFFECPRGPKKLTQGYGRQTIPRSELLTTWYSANTSRSHHYTTRVKWWAETGPVPVSLLRASLAGERGGLVYFAFANSISNFCFSSSFFTFIRSKISNIFFAFFIFPSVCASIAFSRALSQAFISLFIFAL